MKRLNYWNILLKIVRLPELLEQVLPDRSNHGAVLSITRLDYRPYEFRHKLEYSNQLFKTYENYTSIAINAAKNDFEKMDNII